MWDVTALGILPIDDQISAYLRIGAYHATLDASARGVDATSNGNITYGAGLQWDLLNLFIVRNLSVRLDWQRYRRFGGARTTLGSFRCSSLAVPTSPWGGASTGRFTKPAPSVACT